jgi:predicted nucleotidyltransferase
MVRERLKRPASWSTMRGVSHGISLSIPTAELAALCRRYHVRRLSLFGFVLRDDFGPASDVDILVEFEHGRTPGLAFFRLEGELSALFGRRVDLNTRASLSRHFRDRVLFAARDVYVAA